MSFSGKINGAFRGARAGLAVGSVFALAMVALNSRFMDSIPDYILWVLLPPACVGGALGALLIRNRTGSLSNLFTILVLAICIIPPAISRYAYSSSQTNPRSPKLIAIGIDGATWDIVDPMIARGELKNLAGLVKQGASATLVAQPPLMSPALWTTLATGQPRETHGIQSFFNTQMDCRSPRFWEIMHDAKKWTYGIYRWMATWPPTGKGVFEVPDWTARDYTTNPADLEAFQEFINDGVQGTSLKPLREFALGLKLVPHGMRLSMLKELAAIDLKKFFGSLSGSPLLFADGVLRGKLEGIVAKESFERYRPDVATFVLYQVDIFSHLFWVDQSGQGMAGDVAGEKVRQAYRVADEAIGHLLEGVGPQTLVVVVSDHGFEAIHEQKHFQVPSTEKILARSGLETQLRGALIGHRGYFYPAPGLSEEVAGKSLGEILKKLEEFRANDLPLFDVGVVMGGITALVKADLQKPDLAKGTCSFEGKQFPCAEILSSYEVHANHNPRGIFIIRGPGVKKGMRIADVTQFDVTPTMLYLEGLPIGGDMPGKIISDAIEPEWLAKRQIAYIDSYPPRERSGSAGNLSDLEGLKQRLRALGYLQ